MGFVPQSFYDSAVAADYPLAFEPEGGGTDAALNWATMGWGYCAIARLELNEGEQAHLSLASAWPHAHAH